MVRTDSYYEDGASENSYSNYRKVKISDSAVVYRVETDFTAQKMGKLQLARRTQSACAERYKRIPSQTLQHYQRICLSNIINGFAWQHYQRICLSNIINGFA